MAHVHNIMLSNSFDNILFNFHGLSMFLSSFWLAELVEAAEKGPSCGQKGPSSFGKGLSKD